MNGNWKVALVVRAMFKSSLKTSRKTPNENAEMPTLLDTWAQGKNRPACDLVKSACVELLRCNDGCLIRFTL
jgi:hypothetical protein